MTFIRKLADGISRGVVRLAKPSAKDWAQATAREMELIESDWSALGWALGSLRILLLPKQDTPITSPAQVSQAALEFAREIRKRTVAGCAVCAFVAFSFSRLAWRIHHPAQRIGASLVVASVLYMLFQLLARRGRLSSRRGAYEGVSAYRAELERQRDFHCGMWLWSRLVALAPGYLLFCIGEAIAHPANARMPIGIALVFLILGVCAIPLNQRLARKYQRRIDELDALEKAA